MDIGDGDVPMTVCKLSMLSLMEVFKDILPDYRIRLFTSTEKHQKVCHWRLYSILLTLVIVKMSSSF